MRAAALRLRLAERARARTKLQANQSKSAGPISRVGLLVQVGLASQVGLGGRIVQVVLEQNLFDLRIKFSELRRVLLELLVIAQHRFVRSA